MSTVPLPPAGPALGAGPRSRPAGKQRPSILAVAAVMSCLGWTACSDSHARSPAPEAAPAATYKAGHGLQISPTAARFAGLTTAAGNRTSPTLSCTEAKRQRDALVQVFTQVP